MKEKSFHHGGTYFFTTVEQYFCHDGTILLSYSFLFNKGLCDIRKKEEGVSE